MPAPLKYIFLGSPSIGATILRRLAREKGLPSLVVTQTAKAAGRGNRVTATAVEEEARLLGVECLSTENVNSEESLLKIRSFDPDLFIVVAFGQIFKEPLLSIPKKYCLNVHTSLLPRYRGAAPVQWAIYNGDPLTGVTIQKMVKKLDAGDILVQKTLAIAPDDTSETLLAKLAELGSEAVLESFQKIEAGTDRFVPQDDSKVTFAGKIEKAHAAIDWNRTAVQIRNQIRALQPWPVAEAKLNGESLKIFKATVVPGKSSGKPCEISTDAKAQLMVQCGEGSALALEEVQPANRKRMTIAQYLSGFRGQFPARKMD